MRQWTYGRDAEKIQKCFFSTDKLTYKPSNPTTKKWLVTEDSDDIEDRKYDDEQQETSTL